MLPLAPLPWDDVGLLDASQAIQLLAGLWLIAKAVDTSPAEFHKHVATIEQKIRMFKADSEYLITFHDIYDQIQLNPRLLSGFEIQFSPERHPESARTPRTTEQGNRASIHHAQRESKTQTTEKAQACEVCRVGCFIT